MILFVATSPTEKRFVEEICRTIPVTEQIEILDVSTRPFTSLWRVGSAKVLSLIASIPLVLALLFPGNARNLRASLSRALTRGLYRPKGSRLEIMRRLLLEYPISKTTSQRGLLENFISVIQEQQPRIVVLVEETTYNITPIMLGHASGKGIRTVVLPFSNGVATEYRVAARRSRGVSRFHQLVAARLFPEYSLETKDGRLLSLPLHCVVLANHLKVPSARLWGAHLDLADTYLYLDENDYNNALALTSDRRKVHLVEPPQATQVLRNRPGVQNTQRDFVNCKNLNILILVPPNQFPLRCHFKNYKSLLSSYFASIADATSAKTVCLVSIHPREVIGFDLAVLSPLRKFEIVDTATQGLEIADLVVSYGSALNSVVEYLGIPLVSYNIYGLENLDPVSPKITTAVANRNDFSFHVRDRISRIEKGLGQDTHVRRPTVIDALRQS